MLELGCTANPAFGVLEEELSKQFATKNLKRKLGIGLNAKKTTVISNQEEILFGADDDPNLGVSLALDFLFGVTRRR